MSIEDIFRQFVADSMDEANDQAKRQLGVAQSTTLGQVAQAAFREYQPYGPESGAAPVRAGGGAWMVTIKRKGSDALLSFRLPAVLPAHRLKEVGGAVLAANARSRAAAWSVSPAAGGYRVECRAAVPLAAVTPQTLLSAAREVAKLCDALVAEMSE